MYTFRPKLMFAIVAGRGAFASRDTWDNNARRSLEDKKRGNAIVHNHIYRTPSSHTTWDGLALVQTAIVSAQDASRRMALKGMVSA